MKVLFHEPGRRQLQEIVRRYQFSLEELTYQYTEEATVPGKDAQASLEHYVSAMLPAFFLVELIAVQHPIQGFARLLGRSCIAMGAKSDNAAGNRIASFCNNAAQ